MTAEPLGDNHASELVAALERIESLEAERAEVADKIKAEFAQAKATGFDVKAVKRILKLRRADISATHDANSIVEVYLRALSDSDSDFNDWAGNVIESGVV